jgi:hypothetical protein
MRRCPVCSGTLGYRFTATVLGRYQAPFDQCEACGLLRARQPSWLEEAYSEPISLLDTGLIGRNLQVANRLASILHATLEDPDAGRYLDYAGGYGLLTRLMRDRGFDFYWSDRYTQNLFAKGFEYSDDLGPCRAVTAIEVLEHTADPKATVADALQTGGSEILIATTEVFQGPPPAPERWWYYAFETGQHISFFTRQTLGVLAGRLGLTVTEMSGFYVFHHGKALRRQTLKMLWRRALRGGRRPALASKTMQDHRLLAARLRNKNLGG